jgi:hypothetical protein
MAMRPRHIESLTSRYDNDEISQFLLMLEQVEECSTHLRSGRAYKARRALILLDNLAEILLWRRVESVVVGGERPNIGKVRLFDRNEKNALQDFAARLTLAAGVGKLGYGIPPVITLEQRAALRLAHVHRNLAYHRDRHDESVVQLIALLQFEALCALWPAVTSSLGVAGLASNSRLVVALRPYGISPENTRGLRRSIWIREAAQAVSRKMTSELELPAKAVQAHLAMNLLDRVERASGVLHELFEGGLEPDRFFWILFQREFWAREGDDPELVRLTRLSDRRRRYAAIGGPVRYSAEIEQELEEANYRRNLRVMELQRAFRPRATLSVIREASEQAIKLIHCPLSQSLDRYRKHDRALSDLEEYLPGVISSWGQIVDDGVKAALEG